MIFQASTRRSREKRASAAAVRQDREAAAKLLGEALRLSLHFWSRRRTPRRLETPGRSPRETPACASPPRRGRRPPAPRAPPAPRRVGKARCRSRRRAIERRKNASARLHENAMSRQKRALTSATRARPSTAGIEAGDPRRGSPFASRTAITNPNHARAPAT